VPQNLASLLDQVNLLKRLPRTGWLLAGVADPESVAEHTCAVGILALFLAEAINEDPQGQGLTGQLDVGRVVALALIHDLAESVLTDLPKRTTELLGEDVKHQAEERVMADLTAHLPAGHRYQALWREYDAGSTPEALLVKDADKLDMVHQALQYAKRGHRGLDEFWQDHHWNYPLSQALFNVMVDSRPPS
jgi:putative hydrolase of HD superfamily